MQIHACEGQVRESTGVRSPVEFVYMLPCRCKQRFSRSQNGDPTASAAQLRLSIQYMGGIRS